MKEHETPRTGRRGRLRKDAALVEQMDPKVTDEAGRALYRKRQRSSNPSSDRSRTDATSAASCDEARTLPPPSGSSSAGPTTS